MLINYIENHIRNYYNKKNPQKMVKGLYPLTNKIRDKIYKSENYKVNSLLEFLKETNSVLYIENTPVHTIIDLGIVLRTYRIKKSITKLKILTESGISINTVDKIESVKNHMKNTLNKYLELFPQLEYRIVTL